ncbi:MAG TPA: Uma2 family endonuclease [Planctomycetia bacterium]|nr:Uma2 family endonuclease [Planctomycetia bacterium]
MILKAAYETPTLAELLSRFGPIPAGRLRLSPYPATEEDVVRIHAKEKKLCELVDGILLEKTMGYREGVIAKMIARILDDFVLPRNLGVVNGPDGMLRLAPGLVRIPDVSFVSWSQFPGGRIGEEAAPDVHPELAVEVVSPGNAAEEMDDKLADYFAAGTKLVWYVYPKTWTVGVYHSPHDCKTLTESDNISGDPVLPGFSAPVKDLFKLVR